MIFRDATPNDIPQIQRVRNSVRENTLSNPALVSDADCLEYLTVRGKGWVCEVEGQVVGFAIADLREDNIWALFVDPGIERRGVGKTLQKMMLDWYFAQGKDRVWLGTAAGTRAETFYGRTGWSQNGMHGKELRFEMTAGEYLNAKLRDN